MDPTSLKFDIILDDKDFKSKINADIELARRLNEAVSKSLNLNNFTQAATQTAKATEKVTTATKATTEAQKGVQVAIEKSARSLSTGSGSLTRAWLRFSATMWSVISVVRLFVRTIGSAIKNISNFQQANANLATIMQVSRNDIEVLTNDALMLGRTTEWTASQVTELQTALAKLGYNIPQIRNMQASVLQFATAVGAKLPEAANLAGASLRMFGMRSSETQKALEILTAATNKSALDFEKLKVSLPYVGAIAHSIGMDIAQTASLLGVLTNAGLESSRAGTGLRQVLLELSKQNGKLQTAMGGNIKTFDDFVNGLQAMRDRGLQAGEATKLVSTRASSALLILANGVDDIRRLNEEVRDTDGLLKTIQADRLNTLHGSTLLLKSAWEGLIQTFRDSAGPMKDIVDWLTKIVRATSLAAGRANRVAQGTDEIIGSDELTKQFKQMYEDLVSGDMSPEEAQKKVKEKMQEYLESFRRGLIAMQKQGYKETPLRRFLYDSPLTGIFMRESTMGRGRAANEQVEAMENTFDAVGDYMTNRAKEDGEIAAQNFLEKWRMIFDAQGANAAREAMSKVEGYENIKSQVEQYIASGGASGANDRGKGKSADEIQRELINGLKDEANFLRKLLDDYKKLEPYLGEEGAAAKMAEVFGEGDYSKEGIERGILDITAALRGMGKEGKDAAQDIEQSMGLDVVSQVVKQLEKDKKAAEKAEKAMEKYQATVRKWMGEDFNLSGTGFEFDVNKVFSDFNTKVGAVQEKYIKAVGEAKAAHEGDAEAIRVETERLMALRDAEIAYERVKSQESLNDLAESYLKDQYFLRGISMDHLSSLSLKQLSTLKNELKDIQREALQMRNEFSGIEGFLGSLGMSIDTLTEDDLESLKDKLPESTIELIRMSKAIKDTGLTFDVLTDKIQSAIEKGLKNLDEEEKKSIGRLAKYAAGQVLELANAFGELGKATGDAGLVETAEALSNIGEIVKGVSAGAQAGGAMGAIIGGIVGLWSVLLKIEAEYAKFEKQVRMLQEDARHSNQLGRLSVENIFGDNGLQKIREANELIGEAGEKISRFGDISVKVGKYNIFEKEWWINLSAAVNKEYSNFNRYSNLLEKMERDGYKIFDDNGILDEKMLEAAKELYPEMEEEINAVLNAVKEYNSAIQSIEDVGKSIVGSVVSSLTDQIVDSWWEAGQAALDYNDILGDVAKGYARLIVQETLMKAAFDDDRQKAFIEALKGGDAGKAMSIVEGAMQATVDMLPVVNEALQVLEPYRLMSSEGSDTNSVGSGIKSITEETAGLLASYINAIRADVSYMRGMQEKGWAVIESFGLSLPTLNDYIAQIAATNFDMSQDTRSILSELRSVIGSPGTSGMVVRVESF